MTTSDWQAIVKRLRGWGFDIVEHPGCYGRSNGTGWANGRPDGHANHHYVCSLNPDQDYIDSLVNNLAAGNTVNWFADVNRRGYLLGTGPMNHAGTGNSGVLQRVRADQPNYSVAGAAGDMSGNQSLSGTEGQHPGDATPWPQSLLDIMFAINAAEFLQWGYSANRAINHFAWTNRKIDMSWLGGVASDQNGKSLVDNVQKWMDGNGNEDDDVTDDDIDAIADRVMAKLSAKTVRINTVNGSTGKESAADKPYFEAIGATGTDAARAAYRSSTAYPPA